MHPWFFFDRLPKYSCKGCRGNQESLLPWQPNTTFLVTLPKLIGTLSTICKSWPILPYFPIMVNLELLQLCQTFAELFAENEQTYSLQLSDSVSLWAYWVWQTVHSTSVSRQIANLHENWSNRFSIHARTTGQTQDRLHRIWRRAGTSPSQIIIKR